MQILSDEDYKVLSQCSLFQGMEIDELLPLLGGSCQTVEENTLLVRIGDRVDQIWIVLSGALHMESHTSNGQKILYQQLRPGYVAGGDVACTRQKTSPYGLRTKEKSRLWSFSWSLVEEGQLPRELCMQLLQNMMYFIANENIRKYYKLEVVSSKSARERIMEYLTAQAVRYGSKEFDITMDREAMADFLFLNRSVLSHELKKMEAEGLIRFRKNHFELLNEIPDKIKDYR